MNSKSEMSAQENELLELLANGDESSASIKKKLGIKSPSGVVCHLRKLGYDISTITDGAGVNKYKLNAAYEYDEDMHEDYEPSSFEFTLKAEYAWLKKFILRKLEEGGYDAYITG